MSGWGSEENMLQPMHFHKDAPRGLITAVMAKPSGMLWTAMARVISVASLSPPPNETPTARARISGAALR